MESFDSHAAASIQTLLGSWAALLGSWAALLGRWAALLAVAACLQWLSRLLPSQNTISGRLIMPDAHTSSYCAHQAIALPPLLYSCCK